MNSANNHMNLEEDLKSQTLDVTTAPADILSSGLWDPKQKIQLSHAQTLDP